MYDCLSFFLFFFFFVYFLWLIRFLFHVFFFFSFFVFSLYYFSFSHMYHFLSFFLSLIFLIPSYLFLSFFLSFFLFVFIFLVFMFFLSCLLLICWAYTFSFSFLLCFIISLSLSLSLSLYLSIYLSPSLSLFSFFLSFFLSMIYLILSYLFLSFFLSFHIYLSFSLFFSFLITPFFVVVIPFHFFKLCFKITHSHRHFLSFFLSFFCLLLFSLNDSFFLSFFLSFVAISAPRKNGLPCQETSLWFILVFKSVVIKDFITQTLGNLTFPYVNDLKVLSFKRCRDNVLSWISQTHWTLITFIPRQSFLYIYLLSSVYAYRFIRGTFNKLPDFFVQAFKSVVDLWKLSILLLYILCDDWPIFMISGSNEQLQQQLEYTLLKPDCHSRWISKMQSGREEERYAIKFCFKLDKMPQKRMECFRLLFDHLAWIKRQLLSGIRYSRKAGSLWGMMRGMRGVRKSIDQS